jgi:hypothetical protein
MPVTRALPCCGYHVDSTMALGGRGVPRPGSFTLCLNCGALLRYLDEWGAVEQTTAVDDLTPDQRAMVRIAQRFIVARGPIQ